MMPAWFPLSAIAIILIFGVVGIFALVWTRRRVAGVFSKEPR